MAKLLDEYDREDIRRRIGKGDVTAKELIALVDTADKLDKLHSALDERVDEIIEQRGELLASLRKLLAAYDRDVPQGHHILDRESKLSHEMHELVAEMEKKV